MNGELFLIWGAICFGILFLGFSISMESDAIVAAIREARETTVNVVHKSEKVRYWEHESTVECDEEPCCDDPGHCDDDEVEELLMDAWRLLLEESPNEAWCKSRREWLARYYAQ